VLRGLCGELNRGCRSLPGLPGNPWLISKSKPQHFDSGGDFDVLVADDEI
jgi:hypothetical protein